MRFFFLLFFILPFTGFSQNIYFADSNLKNALVNKICVDTDNDGTPDSTADFNQDGEISISEAVSITNLGLDNSNISSVAGLEYFSNLESLILSHNSLSNFPFADFPNLVDLDISFNQLTHINIQNHNKISFLQAAENQITSADITNCSSLVDIILNGNLISNINLQALPSLAYLYLYKNNLSSLSVNHLSNLYELICSENQITSLNLDNLSNLVSVRCYQNALQTISLKGTSSLQFFYCNNNQIQSLDFSESPSLKTLYAMDNDLVYLNIKNGTLGNIYGICQNPNLSFVCVDDFAIEINHIITQLGPGYCNHPNNVTVTTNCNLATNETETESSVFYPNPASEKLYFKSAVHNNALVTISNSVGQLVYSDKIKNQTLDISRLEKGIYFLQITTPDKKVISNKVIKN